MKKMLAMLILGASIALPAAAFVGGDEGGQDRIDRGTSQAPAVYLQTEPANPGTVAGPSQIEVPIQVNDSHDRG
jgi:hypothetical protein